MWVVTSIDYHTLLGQVPLLYCALDRARCWRPSRSETWCSTRAAGSAIPGIGIQIQISEFEKIVIILLVARYLSELKSDEVGIRDLLKLGGLVGIPTVLVMSQPDFGTGATYLPILAAGVLLAGLRWRYLAVIALVVRAGAAGRLVFSEGLSAGAAGHVSAIPPRDPRGRGYQVIQSKIAVGDGGMWGRGVTQGTQTQLRFLPVPHTDFIFSAFAEEHGFVGVVVALGLYFLLLMQIVQNAQTAPDRAGMYICMGVATLLLFHLLVNVGMVVGYMPVTGIPLPLMSSGGSNMFSVFMMLGLVNNVRLRRFVS